MRPAGHEVLIDIALNGPTGIADLNPAELLLIKAAAEAMCGIQTTPVIIDNYHFWLLDGNNISTQFYPAHTRSTELDPNGIITTRLLNQITQPWGYIEYPATKFIQKIGLNNLPPVCAIVCTPEDLPPQEGTLIFGQYVAVVGSSVSLGRVENFHDTHLVIPIGSSVWTLGYFIDSDGNRLNFTLGHELAHYLTLIGLNSSLPQIGIADPDITLSVEQTITFPVWEALADLATGGRFHSVASEEYSSLNSPKPPAINRWFDLTTSIKHPLLHTTQLTNELIIALLLHLNSGLPLESYRYDYHSHQQLYINMLQTILETRQQGLSTENLGINQLLPISQKFQPQIIAESKALFPQWFETYIDRYRLSSLVNKFFRIWITEIHDWTLG